MLRLRGAELTVAVAGCGSSPVLSSVVVLINIVIIVIISNEVTMCMCEYKILHTYWDTV